MSKKPVTQSKITLTAEQISSETTPVGRRTAMKALGATVLGAGATSVAGCFITPARPMTQSGVTDSDGGQYADPVGGGRGAARGV